jgi:hypothetical protein
MGVELEVVDSMEMEELEVREVSCLALQEVLLEGPALGGRVPDVKSLA